MKFYLLCKKILMFKRLNKKETIFVGYVLIISNILSFILSLISYLSLNYQQENLEMGSIIKSSLSIIFLGVIMVLIVKKFLLPISISTGWGVIFKFLKLIFKDNNVAMFIINFFVTLMIVILILIEMRKIRKTYF